jgi:hypothetical protein
VLVPHHELVQQGEDREDEIIEIEQFAEVRGQQVGGSALEDQKEGCEVGPQQKLILEDVVGGYRLDDLQRQESMLKDEIW